MAADDNTWTRILSGVASSSATRKNVVVCGQAADERSRLVESLKQTSPSKQTEAETVFGLGYEHAAVADDQEVFARVGVYSVPSAVAPYDALLDLTILPGALLDTLFVILLDWREPLSFVPQLASWFTVLHRIATTAKEEDRERLEQLVRNYNEPTNKTEGGTSLAEERSSLPAGSLINNLGLNIIVVCSNVILLVKAMQETEVQADIIEQHENRNFHKEETLDYIQQTLRILCLRYGAALIFLSKKAPENTVKLRQYILHRLFGQSLSLAKINNAIAPPTTSLRAFTFSHKTNAIDRDSIFIPAGWDSIGKIRVIQERGFDPDAINASWYSLLGSHHYRVPEFPLVGDSDTPQDDLQTIWKIRLQSADSATSRLSKPQIKTAISEQEFLRNQADLLQKESAKDSRNLSNTNKARPAALIAAGLGIRDAVVGPLSSSALSLPGVEKAMERDTENGDGHEKQADIFARMAAGRDTTSPPLGSLRSPTISSAMSPTSPQTQSTPGTQNEVLASFFQSLLSARKDSSGKSSTAAKSSTGSAHTISSPTATIQRPP